MKTKKLKLFLLLPISFMFLSLGGCDSKGGGTSHTLTITNQDLTTNESSGTVIAKSLDGAEYERNGDDIHSSILTTRVGTQVITDAVYSISPSIDSFTEIAGSNFSFNTATGEITSSEVVLGLIGDTQQYRFDKSFKITVTSPSHPKLSSSEYGYALHIYGCPTTWDSEDPDAGNPLEISNGTSPLVPTNISGYKNQLITPTPALSVKTKRSQLPIDDVCYEITPLNQFLATGLSFDEDTGIISGRPSITSDDQLVGDEYTITALAPDHQSITSKPYNFKILIETPTISSISITNPPANLTLMEDEEYEACYEELQVINNFNEQMTNGSAFGQIGYTITPDLPNGLAIGATTGIISGTPTDVITNKTYTIIAKVDGFAITTTCSFSITILASDLTFANMVISPTPLPSLSGYKNEIVTPSSQLTTKLILSDASVTILSDVVYSVPDDNLPEGLQIDPSNGQVFGTPTGSSGTTTCTISASSDFVDENYPPELGLRSVSTGRVATITIDIIINDERVHSISIQGGYQSNITGSINNPITSSTVLVTKDSLGVTLSNGLGAGQASYTINPTLTSTGLQFDSASGQIAGTPTLAFEQSYSITASATIAGTPFTSPAITITIIISSVTLPSSYISLIDGTIIPLANEASNITQLCSIPTDYYYNMTIGGVSFLHRRMNGIHFGSDWDSLTTVGDSFLQNLFYWYGGQSLNYPSVYTALDLPSCLTTVGKNFCKSAFENNVITSLPSTFNIPSTITSIGDSFCQDLFAGCKALLALPTDFHLPTTISGNSGNVGAHFCYEMFSECIKLSTLPYGFNLPTLTTYDNFFVGWMFRKTKLQFLDTGIPNEALFFKYVAGQSNTATNCFNNVDKDNKPAFIDNNGTIVFGGQDRTVYIKRS